MSNFLFILRTVQLLRCCVTNNLQWNYVCLSFYHWHLSMNSDLYGQLAKYVYPTCRPFQLNSVCLALAVNITETLLNWLHGTHKRIAIVIKETTILRWMCRNLLTVMVGWHKIHHTVHCKFNTILKNVSCASLQCTLTTSFVFAFIIWCSCVSCRLLTPNGGSNYQRSNYHRKWLPIFFFLVSNQSYRLYYMWLSLLLLLL